MSFSWKKLHLKGFVSDDPFVGETKNGKIHVRFRMGIKNSYGDGYTNFTVNLYDKTAEYAKKYLHKKDRVELEGDISCSATLGKDGKPYANMNVTPDIGRFWILDRHSSESEIPEGFTEVGMDEDGLPF